MFWIVGSKTALVELNVGDPEYSAQEGLCCSESIVEEPSGTTQKNVENPWVRDTFISYWSDLNKLFLVFLVE